jgi:hypothetical protein
VVALRAVIANPLTTESDIDEVLLDQLGIASTLTRNPQITPIWRPTTYHD